MKRIAELSFRAAVAASLIVTALVAWPFLLGERLFERDFMRVLVPSLQAVRHWFHDGGGDLVPAIGDGSPILAWPDAQVWSPFTWLFLPLDAGTAATLLCVVHLALAAFCTTWLGRTFRMAPHVASALGASFALSGTVLELHAHGSFIVGAAFIPCIWAAARRARSPRHRRRHLAIMVIASLLLLLQAEPQAFGIAAIIALIESLSGRGSTLARVRRTFTLGLALVAATLVSMPAWSPVFAEAVLSTRASSLPMDIVGQLPFTTAHALATILPGVLVESWENGKTLKALWLGNTWNPTPFIGIPVVVAALVGLSQRAARVPACIALLASAMSFGNATPVLALVVRVMPLFARFRYAEKYFLIATLAIELVAFIAIARAQKRKPLKVALAASALACGMALFAARATVSLDLPARALEIVSSSMFVAALSASAFGLSFFAVRFAPLVTVIVAVVAVPHHIEWGPPLLNARSPLASLASASRGHHLTPVCVDPRDTFTLVTPDVSARYAYAVSERFLLAPDEHSLDGLSAPIPYAASLASRLSYAWHAELSGDHAVAAARALGCSVWVSSRGIGARIALPDIDDAFPTPPHAIVDPLPETFVVDNPQLVTNENDIIPSALRGFAVDDPLHRLAQPLLASRVRIVSLSWPMRDHATLSVEGSGLVALRTRFLVGWTATQNGISLPVVRVNGQHVAVVIDDGARGPIELSYVTPARAQGFVCALVGAVIIAFIFSRRRRASAHS